MSERYEFAKGDVVPQWVERIEPADVGVMIWERDVVVFREVGGVVIWPVSDGPSTMRFQRHAGKEDAPVAIRGAPTRFLAPEHHQHDDRGWIIPPEET